MNILITGGAGFIGTNLSKKLLEMGHNVYIFDDLSTGRYKNIQFLKMLKTLGQLFFYQCDITNLTYLQAIRDNITKKIDQVFHLACPASPPKYYKDPLKTLDINYIGTKNILELSRFFNSRFLISSTSECYGDPLEHPQKESYNGNVNPVSPRSIYDEGKRVAETLVSEYHRQYNIETKIARIFNTYGLHMDPDDGRVVTNMIKQHLTNKPITIYGDGKQTRSFCYVDDQVDGLITLMNSGQFINEPVNIGNPEEHSMLTLAWMISKPKEPNLEFCSLPVSDPTRRCPDISKMKSIGWEPKVCLYDGLKQTTDYIKKELELL